MPRAICAAEGPALNENEPQRHTDPLWYDRAELDEPPGLILEMVAYIALIVLAVCVTIIRVYRLPDWLWCRAWDRIERQWALRTKRH